MPYADTTRIDQILSADGALRRKDDDGDGVADSALLTAMIEWADSMVDQYLSQRYTSADLATSTWVKWCASTIAARQLCLRRGNAPPASVEMEAKAYMDRLGMIAKGHGEVPYLAEAYDDSPSVTNFRINGAYKYNKLRRIQSTSTGGAQGEGLKRHDNIDYVNEQ